MGLQVASIASGSNGNCYYVGSEAGGILVDMGISCKEFERRMALLMLHPAHIKAIFVSHEHTDHICGLEAVQRRHQIPVYINAPTLANSRLKLDPALTHTFYPDTSVAIQSLLVTPFTKRHDAAQPCSFVVNYAGMQVGVLTDIGQCCSTVIEHFAQCQVVFLESNYDVQMLAQGSYPAHLKRRISGSYGHLSNEDALELFIRHRHPALSHLFLAHLSKNNNCPQRVQQLFAPFAGPVHIQVASRYEPSGLINVPSGASTYKAGAQMQLF